MALIPFHPRHLHLLHALPFRVYDAKGQLMLASGAAIDSEDRLKSLREKALFVDEHEAGDWLQNAERSVQSLMLRDARLQDIATARWHDTSSGEAAQRDRSVVERWELAMGQLSAALRDAHANPQWMDRLQVARQALERLDQRYPNQVQFLLFQQAAHDPAHYSSHHAALCAVVCARVAGTLGWPQDDARTLMGAALTMNVAMTQLQDQLALQKEPVSPAQRELIDSHALRSSTQLAAAGVKDPRWLKIVRLHHDASLLREPLEKLDPASRMARLLGVVDRFTAKVSRRRMRPPMSPLAAARAACVGADGRPDELGSGLLKTLGMYPPGSYVRLASGEIGVVLARGERANEPLVAALVGTSGLALGEPALRHTSRSSHAVTGAVPVSEVRVRLQHEKLLTLL